MMNRRALVWGVDDCEWLSGGCGSARPIKYYGLTVPGDLTPAVGPQRVSDNAVGGTALGFAPVPRRSHRVQHGRRKHGYV